MPADATPSKTDTRVPMSGATYQQLARAHGTRLDAGGEAASWFRSLMGTVNWIAARCRPDIAFATHFLSRGMCAPTDVHVTAAIHLLRYLHATHSHGLFFRASDASTTTRARHASTSGLTRGHAPPRRELAVYHDATFASDPLDSSSVAAVVVFLNGTPIDWHVKRIPYVSRSSTDAELYGADLALRFLEDHSELLDAVARASSIMRQLIPTTRSIYTDNTGLEHLANNINDTELRGQRHIRTRIHHLKEAVRDRTISMRWVPAGAMHADILTKCVGIEQFEKMREHLVVAASTRVATR
jgi:hypothetical protein